MQSPAVPPPSIAEAFRRRRAELEIRTRFPDDVLAQAERIVAERAAGGARGHPEHADRTDVEFVTVDPPGSRDLDQAVHLARDGGGYRLRYAIADVGHWVDRGSAIEREAWLRGLTVYAPDERQPLYPPALSEGAASLLPGTARPAVLFDFMLDADANLVTSRIGRALVRSRAQLTYAQLLAHGTAPATSPLAGEPWAETLALLAELGSKLLARERARGGVSLPAREQHVQRRAAETLGFDLAYGTPNAAEGWNAQVSLLTGHVAAERMLAGGIGLLRTMPPFDARDVARLRRAALPLGFEWPEGRLYPEFVHGLDPQHPRLDVLVRQARGVMRGADYVAFDGAPPAQPLHGALAFTYAHATAPLRRLADRYVLDLLVSLEAGRAPSREEAATLHAAAEVMNLADRRTAQWERWIVDAAEAWALRDRAGATLAAVVIDVRRGEVEVQVEDPPIRATLPLAGASPPALGAHVAVRVASADVAAGAVGLVLASAGA